MGSPAVILKLLMCAMFLPPGTSVPLPSIPPPLALSLPSPFIGNPLDVTGSNSLLLFDYLELIL